MNYGELLQTIPLSKASAIALVALVLPLIGFFLLLIFSRAKYQFHGWAATALMAAATILVIWLFNFTWGGESIQFRVPWFQITSGQLTYSLTAGLLIDRLAALMLVVVVFISFLVYFYSIAYMRGEVGYGRYFAFLCLFTFSMMGIVMANNLLIIFIFWELVGVASYALIGFWYQYKPASTAAGKAFIVNRIGDLGFLIALFVLWAQFGTFDLEAVKLLMEDSIIGGDGLWKSFLEEAGMAHIQKMDRIWITIGGLGLFAGAVGKSAQFPLQIWLPDAMEGPTPVSALIHAATMVAAGVFLLARVFVLFNVDTLIVIAYFGAITAFLGAFSALFQNDIKRVLAYSTISQLGYMVMGIGVGAYEAAVFHLVTHAAFKACLFLGAGIIIYKMHQIAHSLHGASRFPSDFNAQDMRFMGGFGRIMPWTSASFMVAGLALAGLPFFSGFLSKDAILNGAVLWATVGLKEGSGFAMYPVVPVLGFLTAFLTAFYIGRQILLVFFGKFRLDEYLQRENNVSKIQGKIPGVMLLPVIVLAILCLGVFYSLNPMDPGSSWIMQGLSTPSILTPSSVGFYTPDIHDMAREYDYGFRHLLTLNLSVLLGLGGLFLAWIKFRPGRIINFYPDKKSIMHWISLSRNSFYLDNLYYMVFVLGINKIASGIDWLDRKIIDGIVNLLGVIQVVLAHLISWFDRYVVDGLVHLVVMATGGLGKIVRAMQGGKLQAYYTLSLLSVIILLLILLL